MKPLTPLLFVNNTLQRRRGARENPFRQVSGGLSPFVEVKPVQAGPVLPMIQPSAGGRRSRRWLRFLSRCWQGFLGVLLLIVVLGCGTGFQHVKNEREKLFEGAKRGAEEIRVLNTQRENQRLIVRAAVLEAQLRTREAQLMIAQAGYASDTMLAVSHATLPPASVTPPLVPTSARMPLPIRQPGSAVMQAKHQSVPAPASARKPGNPI